MSKPLMVRQLALGNGLPKICVPLTEASPEALIWEAVLARAAAADLVEWRADHFAAAEDPTLLLRTAASLRATLQDTPLLFTFRTKAEGGHHTLPKEAYLHMGQAMAQSGYIDLLDIELSQGEASVATLLETASQHKVASMVSSHNFVSTPPREAMLSRLQRMARMGADIPKLAVMPETFADVLSLMAVSEEYTRTANGPVVSMAMGQLGQLSRVGGQFTGSAITFGITGQPSAPGQLPISALRQMLQALGGEAPNTPPPLLPEK